MRDISTLVTDIAALTLWATRVRDGRAGEQILPGSIWASDADADDDDPITRSSGVFWDRICWREGERGWAKIANPV